MTPGAIKDYFVRRYLGDQIPSDVESLTDALVFAFQSLESEKDWQAQEKSVAVTVAVLDRVDGVTLPADLKRPRFLWPTRIDGSKVDVPLEAQGAETVFVGKRGHRPFQGLRFWADGRPDDRERGRIRWWIEAGKLRFDPWPHETTIFWLDYYAFLGVPDNAVENWFTLNGWSALLAGMALWWFAGKDGEDSAKARYGMLVGQLKDVDDRLSQGGTADGVWPERERFGRR